MIAPVSPEKPSESWHLTFSPATPKTIMKKSGPSHRKPTQALVSALKMEHTPHGLGAVPSPVVIVPSDKPAKPFSKSRDLHEDRGERQIKTAKNPRTLPHTP